MMGHGHHTSVAGAPLMVALIIIAIIVGVAIIILLVRRGMMASDGLTPVERKELPFQEQEILSMLRQHGGPMRQIEVVDTLSGDIEDMAGIMKSMETKGLIHRKWNNEQGTYIVSTRAEEVQTEGG